MNANGISLRSGALMIFAAIFAIVLLPTAGGWATARAAPVGSGLPLPRFVSLRAQEVNMRAGPGVRYPVEWVYKRRYLPVQIIAEYRTWRKVRDWQGTQGWVHQSMLGGRRSVIVTGSRRTLRAEPDTKSRAIARMEPGVIGKLEKCPSEGGWCRIEAGGRRGWLRRVEFWGVQQGEAVN